MIRTAIFLEGQTELIFVREFLLRIFEYQNLNIACYTLFSEDDKRFHATDYAYPDRWNEEAGFYFQLINVGNDNSVLRRILSREKQLWKEGFEQIIGLRDMYSKAYRKAVQDARIDPKINEKFIKVAQKTLSERAERPEKIQFLFAIMEVEAWFLGIPDLFENLDATLTPEYIEEKLGFNLREIDPEKVFFHPSKQVEAIYALVGKRYDKQKNEVNTLVSYISKDDYELLFLDDTRCLSFSKFYESIPRPEEEP